MKANEMFKHALFSTFGLVVLIGGIGVGCGGEADFSTPTTVAYSDAEGMESMEDSHDAEGMESKEDAHDTEGMESMEDSQDHDHGEGAESADETLPWYETHSPYDEVVHDHGSHDHGSHDHGELIDLSELGELPTVSVVATPDGMGGAMLQFTVTGIQLVPADPPSTHRPGEGHLHVLLDGEVVAMIATSSHQLDGLSNGHHEVEVALSANDHRTYAVGEEVIRDTTMFIVDGGGESASPDRVFSVEISDGTVVGGIPRFEAELGDLVRFTVISDTGDDLHLHVYDRVIEVRAGMPAVFDVDADIPGVFEAEFHDAGFSIFKFQVS